jgi:hypothetical protein
MLKKVSLTNLVVALIADALVNNKTVALVVAAAVRNAKCMTLFAQLAVKKLKFLSVQAVTVLYIAATASAKTTDVTRIFKRSCLAGAFLDFSRSAALRFIKPKRGTFIVCHIAEWKPAAKLTLLSLSVLVS